jgi:DNA-binding beta-propeller fold protein YncE
MNKIKKQSLAALAAAGLAFGLVACGDDSSSSTKAPDEETSAYAGVVFDGGDYQVQEGELRWIDKDGKISEKSLSFYQDSKVITNGADVYVLEGLGTDNISKVNPELIEEGAEKAVAWQEKFANANPVDMAFDGEKAWVALQNADSLVLISTKDGKVLKSIKTGEFASKEEKSPYVADIELAKGVLYALFVRYSADAEYNFTYPRGLVAIYDAETGKLQDTVQLVTNNPTAMSLYKGNLYVASLGEYDDKADDNRGVEKVDLKAKKSELIISGEKLGAGIYGFVAEEETAYAAIYNGWGSTPVVKIDLEKKTFEKVECIADAQKTMAVKNGVLYVGDHTYGEEKVYFYKDGKLTALEQPKGAQAPYSIALF